MKDVKSDDGQFAPLDRPSSPEMDALLGLPFGVLDHGFVRVVDYMGNEAAVVQAARVSYGMGLDTPKRDRSLLRYLMRHAHTSPFEMVEIKLHVKLPVFVARQWIRHRTASVNEISGRYTQLPEEFYLPDLDQLMQQSQDNKQGRGERLSEEDGRDVRNMMEAAGRMDFTRYRGFISAYDLAKELARINLPLSTYTEFYWKIDLHNLLHFLKLRLHDHAQYEIRAYAQPIWNVVQNWLPNIADAFEDYCLNSYTFSEPEIEFLRDMLATVDPSRIGSGVDKLYVDGSSKREVAELLKQLEIVK